MQSTWLGHVQRSDTFGNSTQWLHNGKHAFGVGKGDFSTCPHALNLLQNGIDQDNCQAVYCFIMALGIDCATDEALEMPFYLWLRSGFGKCGKAFSEYVPPCYWDLTAAPI